MSEVELSETELPLPKPSAAEPRVGMPPVARGRTFRAAAVITDVACGGASVALGVAHLQAVVAHALAGEGLGGAKHFTYDFYFVSLLLVGALLVIPGALCLLRAIGLARRRRGAWNGAMRATLVLAAVNGALMPVHDSKAGSTSYFAILLGALAGLNLIVLLLSRRHYPAEPRT
jgi:lysylphosphatidylglycerol synthetase-like protein (DUF2156 family)